MRDYKNFLGVSVSKQFDAVFGEEQVEQHPPVTMNNTMMADWEIKQKKMIEESGDQARAILTDLGVTPENDYSGGCNELDY